MNERVFQQRFWFPTVILLLAGAACSASADEPAASWPRFHGPQGANRSAETGLLRQWPEGGPRRLWTAQGIGEGFATVAIADGRIYTAGNVNDQTALTALDTNGKLLWQVPNGGAWTAIPGEIFCLLAGQMVGRLTLLVG